MNRPTYNTDTAEAWRLWAVVTYLDPTAVILRRRRLALREAFPSKRKRAA